MARQYFSRMACFKAKLLMLLAAVWVLTASLTPTTLALRLGKTPSRRRRGSRPFSPLPRASPSVVPSVVPSFRKYKQLDDEDEAAGVITSAAARVGVQPPVRSATKQAVLPRSQEESSKKKQPQLRVVKSAEELRKAVLDDGLEFRQIDIDPQAIRRQLPTSVNATLTSTTLKEIQAAREQLQQHPVLQLLSERYHSQSMPGNRTAGDTETIALCIEGGGMRGAVSAGMASAIACLGLCDAFDSIYGSSAGSVIGAYMVSRQMAVDIYVDILPQAKRKFVCVRRILSALALNAVDWVLPSSSPKLAHRAAPGMNVSFVLDGILADNGIRPLDMDAFYQQHAKQPLRVASSCVINGTLITRCFDTQHYFGDTPTQRLYNTKQHSRQGLFACLEAGMSVPGAAGPPVPLLVDNAQTPVPYFDAFCFEPLPYRSAVQDGATHVLVLASRPADFLPKTQPGFYERGVAPLFFRSHQQEAVAQFFEQGGQQYIYAEDMMVLSEGLHQHTVAIPPPAVLYGTQDPKRHSLSQQRDNWKRAHLLPVVVPEGTPELSTLEQDKDEVLEAVRGGFAAAFDLLTPVVGLDHLRDVEGLTGEQVARLVFPKMQDDTASTTTRRRRAFSIKAKRDDDDQQKKKKKRYIVRKKRKSGGANWNVLGRPTALKKQKRLQDQLMDMDTSAPSRPPKHHAQTLLGCLPGLKQYEMPSLFEGLHYTARLRD